MDMNMKDVCDAGSDILNAVADAVETQNYSNLNTTIRNRVSDLSVGISKSVSDGAAKMADKADELGKKYGQSTQQSVKYSSVQKSCNGQKMQPASYFARRRISRLNSIGMIIAGILGLMFVTFLLYVLGIILKFSGSGINSAVATGGAAVFVASGVGFSLLLGKGISLNHLIERYYRYAELVGSSEFFSIKDLSQKAGREESNVRKDLKKMMKRKMIDARMDDSGTTVMLTDHAYERRKEPHGTGSTRAEESEGTGSGSTFG